MTRAAAPRVVPSVDEARLEQLANALARAAASPARVVLFGSHARGEARADSDVDFLVIEASVEDRVAEAGRLRRALGNVGVAVDILVYSDEQVEEWGEVENTTIHEALSEGRLLAQT